MFSYVCVVHPLSMVLKLYIDPIHDIHIIKN